MCVSTIIPLSVSTDTTIPSTTTTHTITGIDNRVDNSNTYYTVMTTTIDQSTVSLCVAQVDDKILDGTSLVYIVNNCVYFSANGRNIVTYNLLYCYL